MEAVPIYRGAIVVLYILVIFVFNRIQPTYILHIFFEYVDFITNKRMFMCVTYKYRNLRIITYKDIMSSYRNILFFCFFPAEWFIQ